MVITMSSEKFNIDKAKINNAFGTPEDFRALLEKMQESCPKYIPTEFPALDRILNGGLTTSLYVLGAMPSLGKSTFLINMSEKMACSGTTVLYFSLEMPISYIASGTFCRCLFNAQKDLPETKRFVVTAAELLDINKIKEIKEQVNSRTSCSVFEEAFKQYKKIGENFYIIDRNFIGGQDMEGQKTDSSTVAASFISRFVNNFKRSNPDKKEIVVIIDYLQLLRPEKEMKNPTERAVIDHSIAELWKIAYTNGMPVIAISSINRTSYNEPIDLGSFKESGGIEFSADVVWGLQLKGTEDKGKKKDKETNKNAFAETRDMQLVVLKNRYGPRGSGIDFKFDTKFGMFIEENDPASPKTKENEDEKTKDKETEDKKTEDKKTDNDGTNNDKDKASSAKKSGSSMSNANLYGYINNSKIANELKYNSIIVNDLKKKFKQTDEYTTTISKKGGKKVQVTYALKYTGKDGESEPLFFMDWVVMDAVLSFYYRFSHDIFFMPDGCTFTVSDLLEFMAGRDRITGKKTKPYLEKRIEMSLHKFQNIEMTIDITEECKMRNIEIDDMQKKPSCLFIDRTAEKTEGNDEQEERIKLKGLLLSLSQKENRYCINEEPLLYEYGDKISGQVFSYRPDCREAVENAHISERTILERYYLVNKIEIQKHLKKNQFKITFCSNDRSSGIIPAVANLTDSHDNKLIESIKNNMAKKTIPAALKHFQGSGYIDNYVIKSKENAIIIVIKSENK